MSSDDLLPAALALSTKERAKLAREILQSLHQSDDADVDAVWVEEIDRRPKRSQTDPHRSSTGMLRETTSPDG
jgi:hypothetical protein